MEKIKVEVHWEDKNYSAGWGMPGLGTVLCTQESLDGLKAEFAEALRFHVEGCVADGDKVPAWLASGEYEIEYDLQPSALLRQAERYTTLAAISKATGINVKQLSHYANATKKPRPEQQRRIKEGLRAMAQGMMALL